MANVLSLDQSSQISGYAIFYDGQLQKCGKIILNDSDLGIRLYKFRTKINELVEQFGIDKIIFEDIQLQTNTNTYKVLAEVFGVLLEYCTENKIPYEIYAPSSWRSKLQIKGKARAEQKKNAQLYVKNNFNIEASEDEADAICIGYASLVAPKDKPIWA